VIGLGGSLPGALIAQRRCMPLPLAEVRAHALAEHAHLRARIESLVRESLPTARRVGHGALHALLDDLRSAVQSHAELEEQELGPLLQTIDAWGSVRVSELQQRHEAILRAIDAFAADVAPGTHHPLQHRGATR